MIRCLKTTFKCSQFTRNSLYDCNRFSAQIWNDCLVHAKNYSLSNNGKWIGRSQLQSLIKKTQPLHSQSIQAVAHKYLYSRKAARMARIKGYDNKYPYKKKKYFNTKWVDQAFKVLPNNVLQLSNGVGHSKLYVKLNCDLSNIDIKEVELSHDKQLYFCITYDNCVQPIDNTNSTICGVDLGEIHAISAYSTNEQALIITGRKMRSIHRFRNKKVAELQRKMSKCKKYSRQWKRYNRAKKYLLNKSERQLKDCMHKTTKQFVDWCIEQQIKTVVVGEVEGVQRHTKGKKRKKTTQKLSNWSFGKIQDYLKYKLESIGVNLVKQEESYTSQQCPCCGRRKKTSTRNYQCKCGYHCHRDIHGARNIASKYLYKEIRYIGEIQNTTYLRVA